MRILFIVPPQVTYEDFINPGYNFRVVHKKGGDFGRVLTDMPLAILSLSAYVKKYHAVESRCIDFNVLLNELDSYEYQGFKPFFMERIAKEAGFNPDVVCVTCLFTASLKSFLEVGDCCRLFFPKAKLLGGGGIPTTMYREIYQSSEAFDALCYGEGEKPLLGFLQAQDKKTYLRKTPAWITREKVLSGESYRFDFVEDLDEIPFGDYEILNTPRYGLSPTLGSYPVFEDKQLNFHYMTSRGCIYRCAFCAAHAVHGRKVRHHSIERVRQDLTRLRDEYGARIIVFQDDHFVWDRKHALDILGVVKELGLSQFIQSGFNVNAMDREFLTKYRETGGHQLVVPVESGSARVLKLMRKPQNLASVKKACELLRELDIYINVNMMIGFPGETKQDIEDARRFLPTLYANWFSLFIAAPLSGSEMYDTCLKKGYIKKDHIGVNYKKATLETEDFTADYIQEMHDTMNLELNFVYNSDFRLGEWAKALKGFENSIEAKNDHAIAYYYASKCYEHLGNGDKARRYMSEAERHLGGRPFWRKYAELFKIPITGVVNG